MRHITKGTDPLKDKNAFIRPVAKGRKVLISIPAPLHGCIDEIRYKEGITLRGMVGKTLAQFIGQEDLIHKPSTALQLCSVKADKTVYASVILTEEEHSTLRSINHYWKVSYSAFLVDALIKLLVKEYGETYPDAPGMDTLKEAIKQ